MLAPTEAANRQLDELVERGSLDLGAARVAVEGEVGYVYFKNPRYLNAEDDEWLGPVETAIDLVLLHPDVKMGVLRGDPVEHPKYAGRRIFSAVATLGMEGKRTFGVSAQAIIPRMEIDEGRGRAAFNADRPTACATAGLSKAVVAEGKITRGVRLDDKKIGHERDETAFDADSGGKRRALARPHRLQNCAGGPEWLL